MTAKEYFESQAQSNKWLKELTIFEQLHIQIMLAEYSSIRLEAMGYGVISDAKAGPKGLNLND